MVTDETVTRGEIFVVALNPTRGPEIRKTRSYVIVSPDDLNAHLRTFIVVPLTTGAHPYPFRVRDRFDGKDGHVVAD
jgi:mRNA interferase MazF